VVGTQTAVPKYTNPGLCFPLVEGSIPQGAGTWSVFMSPVRTNNDVEGWHNRFNSNVVTRGPVPFYHLVTELYAESTDIPIQLKLISERKLKR
jgi:hypothetical protein